MSGPVLAGTGLVKRFGPATALAGVDLTVPAGASVAIMGPGRVREVDAAALSRGNHPGPGKKGQRRCGHANGCVE